MISKLLHLLGVVGLVCLPSCGDVPHTNPFDPNSWHTSSCAGAPVISSVSPTSGTTGDTITINGSNLTGITSVTFGTTQGTVATRSATTATVIVPTLQTGGTVDVTVANACGSNTLSNSFNYQ